MQATIFLIYWKEMILEVKDEGTLVSLHDFYDVCVICVQSRYGIKKPATESEMGLLITDVVESLCKISLFEDHTEGSGAIIKRLKNIYCYNWPVANG